MQRQFQSGKVTLAASRNNPKKETETMRTPGNATAARATILFATLVMMTAAPLAQAAFIAVGTYDENSTQTNTVDTDATADGNTNQVGSATFTTDVAAAFSNGTGGVADFDSGTLTNPDENDSSTNMDITFDSGSKSLRLTRSDGGMYNGPGDLTGGTGTTPISGSDGILLAGSKKGATGDDITDFIFDIGDISGANAHPNEKIVSFALTLLSRDNSSFTYPISITGLADLSGGGSVSVNTQMSQSDGSDDTFFGFTAPAGQWITRVEIEMPDGVFTQIDDLGFTTTIIPEPASVLLLALGGLALLRRRPRRR